MKAAKIVVMVFVVTLLMVGCSETTEQKLVEREFVLPPVMESPEKPVITEKFAATVRANEAGKIMVLMYHVIGAGQESSWAQTSDYFRRDLQTLYDQGYTLIRLNDLMDHHITVPAGKTPVVLTFDDGSEGQFRYITGVNGQNVIDPDCAVGILLEFGKTHPDFGHTATFYINHDPPFKQKDWKEKLQQLVDLGFDIGNHSLTHPKLSQISSQEVQKELAGLAKLVEETVPGYRLRSLALPYGLAPQDNTLALKGSWEGYSYEHDAVLRVGANPTLSPVDIGFDAARLPRIQANTSELKKWLEYFQNNPQERYISDGDSETISLPRERESVLNPERLMKKNLILW